MGWDWGHKGRMEERRETWLEEGVQDMSWLRQSTNNCLGCMGRTVATRSERGMDLRVLHQPVGPDDARGEDGAGRLGRAIARTKDGKDDGTRTAQRSKEGLRGRLSTSSYGERGSGRNRNEGTRTA